MQGAPEARAKRAKRRPLGPLLLGHNGFSGNQLQYLYRAIGGAALAKWARFAARRVAGFRVLLLAVTNNGKMRNEPANKEERGSF